MIVTTFDFENKVNICTTHLPVSNAGEVIDMQRVAVENLLNKISGYENVVLCGDMNTLRGSGLFEKMSEKYQDNIPKNIDTTIDQDLHRVKGLKYVTDGFLQVIV